ncbi:hypothetical protein [Streptomyces sp. NPDC101166]|uniref:hypothetical protein n=1 Tax=Streptomyces sp. NPDC101166 TaxID=3366120 RepID=UPI0037FC580C
MRAVVAVGPRQDDDPLFGLPRDVGPECHAQAAMGGQPLGGAPQGDFPLAGPEGAAVIGSGEIDRGAEPGASGDQFTMRVVIHAMDRWDFNEGMTDVATGTPDSVNGRFAELGWAAVPHFRDRDEDCHVDEERYPWQHLDFRRRRAMRLHRHLTRTLPVSLVTALTLTSCGSETQATDSPPRRLVGECTVRQEIDQVTARFPAFKELESTSWCGITPKSESRVPGPTDVRLVGVLNSVDDAAVRKHVEDPALSFKPLAPQDVPSEIEKALPEGAQWMASEQFDKLITGDLYSGTFYIDEKSAQVLFDCMNPIRKDEPAPSVVTVG